MNDTNEWVPTPHGDPVNGCWPPASFEQMVIWQDGHGKRFLAGTDYRADWLAKHDPASIPVAWHMLRARWEPPKQTAFEKVWPNHYSDLIKEGVTTTELGIIARLGPLLEALCRAILAEHKR